ncbi:Uncharacterized protein TCAP_01319 [Tolypocladium capitatum]|uniref:Uncharacterized protein n=1 Tax=Tolypocladium capitatum TaxID=45235 RepID=A0A2K3QML4_9HYPO|nr:Uncharacterized protein TCAP_01319 [Tolypocladium capitatum]
MSNPRGLYATNGHGGGQGNFGVDYAICYKVPPEGAFSLESQSGRSRAHRPPERAEAEAGFVQLVEALTHVGLATEVRNGQETSLLVFVRVASRDLLAQQVYRARLQDWLHGVRTSEPGADISRSLEDEPVTEAERLRLVYQMIARPENEGGAGITETGPRWKYVDGVFPVHDQAFNKAWIQKWSKKYLLDQADIDEIRNKFGENVAFYFAFLRSYFLFLVFPSVFGFVAWFLMGQFSYLYALGCGLWSVVFLEYWKQKEVDLGVRWGVRGVSSIQYPRSEFRWECETEDPVTGEPKRVYPQIKRIQTQLLQMPFAFACVVVLGGLVVICNSLEIFINEVYDGPFKQYLAFLPTVLMAVFTPTFSTVLMSAANALTERENYETMDSYHAALVQKQFVLNFMTSYMALLFTAFVYIPFGNVLVPMLDFWRTAAQTVTLSEKPLPTQIFHINPQRISSQMFYFTVTAQIVNLATEVVVPYVMHEASAKAKEFQGKGTAQSQDRAEEAEFLKRVRDECQLEVYDVTGDYREMVMQYGYLLLFSVAWPLAACCFLVNNWVELRSDALKIAISCRRPIPWRSDSIGPWLTAIGFLSWLGSITSAAIVYLCSGTRTSPLTAWGGLLGVLLAEHFYLLVQLAVRHVMSRFESPGLQQERKERYLMKRRLLQENLGQDVSGKASAPGVAATEKILRETLQEEARGASIRGQGPQEERFWQRQLGMEGTILAGRRLIEQGAAEGKKTRTGAAPGPKA